jgi:radical SAM superfamily enzyme YgiQ (UPF0313 family)
MRCSYCSTAAIEGCGIRSRSPEAVVRWLRKARDAGFTRFFFTDNTFNLPPSYAKKLCREIIAADLGVSWTSIVYPSRVDDELVGLMAEAGAVEVSLGFESGAPAILHAMNKRFTLEEVRRVSEAFGSAGIRRMGFLMLGGPGETLDTAQASIEFADSLNLEMVKLIVGIRIYPETALAHRAVDEGLIDPEDDLLAPRFYVAPQLERRLTEIAEQWISARANWIG